MEGIGAMKSEARSSAKSKWRMGLEDEARRRISTEFQPKHDRSCDQAPRRRLQPSS